MTVMLETRSIESPAATEIYITATPGENAPPHEQAQEMFSAIRDVLGAKNACILQERIFGDPTAIKTASHVRSEIYGNIDDGVAASFLTCKQGMVGPIAGAQVHALVGQGKTDVVCIEARPCGRVFRAPGHTYLTLSSISVPQLATAVEQAEAAFARAESALKQFGADFLSVPRTWMWLGDILSWYDDFNQVRNRFFAERKLIGPGTRQSMPASTGIGLWAADASHCAMDLVAVLEPPNSTEYLQAVGRQQCALEYGSAFSRASRAMTPAGQTIFVSGTASIDANGATTNIGDARGQINTTIENVRAVLRDTQTDDDDVVQAVAYCKTAEVEEIFNEVKRTLRWPIVTVICDICRADLLFEMEATACKATSAR